MVAVDHPVQSLLETVRQPVETARGLPNALYTDDNCFQLEREKVFFANWAAIGFGKDIPKPGDAMPVDFLGIPLCKTKGNFSPKGVS